jgi:hypothetical protein
MKDTITLFLTYKDILGIYILLLILNLIIDFSIKYGILVTISTPLTKKFFADKISFGISLVVVSSIELLLKEMDINFNFSIFHGAIIVLCIYEIIQILNLIPPTFLTKILIKYLNNLISKIKEKYN